MAFTSYAKQAATPRPVSADGLTYTDTGEPTPEGMRRQEAQRIGRQRGAQPVPQQPTAQARNVSTPAEEQASRQSRQEGGHGFWAQGPLGLASSIFGNPIVNPIGYAAGKAGGYVDNALGTSLSGYIQDPVGQGLADIGAPDAVQVISNPTGYATRRAVNSGTQYGTNVPAVAASGIQGGQNIVNDARNTVSGVKNAANGFVDLLRDAGRAPPQVTGSGTGTAVGASSGIPSEVQRPDSYRSDEAMQGFRQLLAAEQQPGPSKAEALLSRATDRAASQALGIAAGTRGGAGARQLAQRQALAANAAMSGQASSDLAALRADEEQQRRARQAQIMGLFSGAAQAGDARDLGYVDTATRARQAEAELANTAYQQNANRELQRAIYNAQQPTGFLDDPLGGVFSRLFGGPLRSGAKI